MTTMTYGQLVEAYVAVRDERDRLRAELAALRAEIDRLRTERDRLRTPRIEDGATVHIDDGRYTVVDVDFRGETAVVTLRPTTTGDSDA